MNDTELYFRQEQERLRHELRLLLSWCMKVQAVDAPMEPAQHAVKTWRSKLQTRSDEVMVGLGKKRNELHNLPELFHAGKLDIETVNQKSRALHDTITRHQVQISFFQKLFEIANVEMVGGFIDLPLQRYPKKFRSGLSTRWHQLSSADRIALMAAGMCLVVLPLLALFLSHWGVDVFFSVDVHDTYDELALYCNNATPRPVYLSPDVGQQPIQRNDAEIYMITIYGKTKENSTFQHLPLTLNQWRYNGKSLASGRPVMLEPGEETVVYVPLKALRQMMPEIHRIQIKCAPQFGAETKVLESAL